MLSLLLLAGCRPNLTPTYAFDPIWLAPAEIEGEAGVTGFQTWQIYGPRWPKNFSDRHYNCSVLVELSGLPFECDADKDCSIAWEIVPEIHESDCTDERLLKDPLFVSLLRVGLGGEEQGPEVPWPGETSVGFADYGNGWEIHGHAYPESLDTTGEGKGLEWDDEQPFLFVPTRSFPL